MKKPNWKQGLRWAAEMAAFQIIMGAAPYLGACGIFGRSECSFSTALQWYIQHPFFPAQAAFWIVVGFLAGAFISFNRQEAPTPKKYQVVIASLFAIVLIIVFALWGLPDLGYLWSLVHRES